MLVNAYASNSLLQAAFATRALTSQSTAKDAASKGSASYSASPNSPSQEQKTSGGGGLLVSSSLSASGTAPKNYQRAEDARSDALALENQAQSFERKAMALQKSGDTLGAAQATAQAAMTRINANRARSQAADLEARKARAEAEKERNKREDIKAEIAAEEAARRSIEARQRGEQMKADSYEAEAWRKTREYQEARTRINLAENRAADKLLERTRLHIGRVAALQQAGPVQLTPVSSTALASYTASSPSVANVTATVGAQLALMI